MAGARFDLFTVILSLHILVVVVLSQQDDLNSTDTSHVSIPTTTMILPLYLSPPKNTSSSHIAYRRHLLSPSARMSLHDDLLLNGYYTTRLLIGTPPQKFALIVDTGSTVTYVPCATCEQCGRHQDPRFQPKMSSTYEAMKCNIDCTCDSDRENCIYERQYAEMSSSSGVLGEDIVSFGNLSELTPQRAVFGCENMETGDLYSQHADGIMGLGRGDLSIVDQLVDKKVINDSFSLCYGGMDIGGGTMVLGKISPPADMVYSQSDPVRSPYYNIELKELHVAGKALPLDSRVFDGKHGSVLDSGTTYAYLPEPAFKAFKDAMMKELNSLKQIKGPDPNYNDLCFSGAGSEASELSKTFPTVDMVFGNGQKLTLSPENYLFRHSKERGAYCFGIFQNGKDPTTLLGGIVVRNTLVTYDREHEKIGFWKTNCSELWERLQGASSTTQNGIPPSLAPNGSPELDTSGETNIGLVTFNMLLNTTYSDLEPRIPELTESIANELDVNTSQVHLMNYTSKGNDTLLTWSIFPQGSNDYMSNSTATEIISRISENRVHLPEIFGSYKFSEWKTEPSSKRTWWEENSMIVIVAFLIILILGLSMSGAWYMWRRNKEQSVVSYKPVDSIVPEQELQPL